MSHTNPDGPVNGPETPAEVLPKEDSANQHLSRRSKRTKEESFLLKDIVEAVLIAVILAVLIRMFVIQPFYIPSSSMEPTLKPGDRIIVNKFIYRFKEIQRGDVMVFKYPLDPSRDFIKRVIGLPGDTLEIRDSVLYINDNKIAEPYLPKGLRFGSYGPVKIPQDEYFMMGDNRNNSEDSRVWGFLPREKVVGKAFVVFWPIDRVKILH